MTVPVRSIRLEGRTKQYLDNLSGMRGEVFFDNETETLRVYSGVGQSGIPLLRADFSNIAEGDTINFNGKSILADLTGQVTGQVSDISNHSIGGLADVDVAAAISGQVLYYTGTGWEATTLSSTFNGGNVGGITNFLNITQSTATNNGGLTTSGGLGVAKNINVGGNAVIEGSISATNNLSINTNKFTVNATTGNIVAAGTASFGGNTDITGSVTIKTGNELKFYDTDNSNFVGLKAASNVASNVTFILPPTDGDPGQVLATDGAGSLSWTTAGTGGGGGGSDPAGSTGQIQYNNLGVFAADVDFFFTAAENKLTVPNIAATAITGTLTGNLIGDVYASNGSTKIIENGTNGTNSVVYADLEGDVTGNVTGDVTGAVTSSDATVTGGSIDNTSVGATTPSTGAFTTVTASGQTTFTNTTDSSNPTSGAVKVSGGLGVSLNTHVGGNITANGDIIAGGNITAGNAITIETAPINTTDATNKQYVDARAIAMSVALS